MFRYCNRKKEKLQQEKHYINKGKGNERKFKLLGEREREREREREKERERDRERERDVRKLIVGYKTHFKGRQKKKKTETKQFRLKDEV